MRIQYNQGLFTQNRYNYTNTELNKTLNKLSSGYQINQAADDAAGLAISEKMRAQIRGLEKAQTNIQDGISLLQTADSALGNIVNPNLQRIRELTIQAANDTLTNIDRDKIQLEVNQIIEGIDNIATDTEFNTLPLLAGTSDAQGNIGTGTGIGTSTGTSTSLPQIVQQITTTGGITNQYTFSGKNYASAIIDFSNLNSANDIGKLDGKGVYYTCCTCNKAYSIKFVDGSPDVSRLNDFNPVMEVDISAISNGTDLVNKIIETAYGQQNYFYDPTTPLNNLPTNSTSFVQHYSQLAVDGTKIYIYDNRPENASSIWPQSDRGVFKLNVYGEEEPEPNQEPDKDLFLHLKIQVGSNEGQNVTISLPNVTVEQLKIKPLLINTQKNANTSIAKVDAIIEKISSARSYVGASQNRLEHAHNNVLNTKENLTKAESQLRDTDMAKEMSKLKKDQVLLQSSQSMMAQINQMSQGILEILG